MAITIKKEGVFWVLTPSERRLDVQTVPAFKTASQSFIDQPDLQVGDMVILDLSTIGFVDSTGLGALLSLLRGLGAKNIPLRLSCLQDQVNAMFRLVRMYKVFDIYGTLEEAQAP